MKLRSKSSPALPRSNYAGPTGSRSTELCTWRYFYYIRAEYYLHVAMSVKQTQPVSPIECSDGHAVVVASFRFHTRYLVSVRFCHLIFSIVFQGQPQHFSQTNTPHHARLAINSRYCRYSVCIRSDRGNYRLAARCPSEQKKHRQWCNPSIHSVPPAIHTWPL